MELYILRHGDAVDALTGGYAHDADRPLTEEGRAEVTAVAAALHRLGLSLDRLLTSPLVRARQTADLVAEHLSVAEGPLVSPVLAPGGDVEGMLAAARGARRVMLVGHMPSLGQLAGWLTWGAFDLVVPLRTAGLCRVDLGRDDEPGEGDLRWLLPPRLTRRLK